mgnify:CR=1 FL=1
MLAGAKLYKARVESRDSRVHGRGVFALVDLKADETLVEYEMGYAADEFGNVLNGPFSGEKSSYQIF